MTLRTFVLTGGWFLAAAAQPDAGACIDVDGDRILAGDLAKAIPAFQSAGAGEPIGFAPLAGARRVLLRDDIARLAVRFGLPAEAWDAVCFQVKAEPIHSAALLSALRAALRIPEGQGEVELVDYSRHAVPAGEIVFPPENARRSSDRADGSAMYRGRVLYGGRRSVPIWVRVKIKVESVRVVAVNELPAGQPISEAQIRLRSSSDWPAGGAVTLTRIEDAVGRVPRRAVRAGDALDPVMLTRPKDVNAGDVVEVEVVSGAARLRFTAKATSGGKRGDTVVMINSQNGARFAGRIEDRGKASVPISAVSRDEAQRKESKQP